MYYDASPGTLEEVKKMIDTKDSIILRQTHLKARSILDHITNMEAKRPEKNYYVKKVLQKEWSERQQQQRSNESADDETEKET